MRLLTRILLLSSAVAFPITSLFSDDRVPILSLDLRTLGYLPPVAERDLRYYSFVRGAVTFLDDQTLAVSFLRKNEHPGLSRRRRYAGQRGCLPHYFSRPLDWACARPTNLGKCRK